MYDIYILCHAPNPTDKNLNPIDKKCARISLNKFNSRFIGIFQENLGKNTKKTTNGTHENNNFFSLCFEAV